MPLVLTEQVDVVAVPLVQPRRQSQHVAGAVHRVHEDAGVERRPFPPHAQEGDGPAASAPAPAPAANDVAAAVEVLLPEGGGARVRRRALRVPRAALVARGGEVVEALRVVPRFDVAGRVVRGFVRA